MRHPLLSLALAALALIASAVAPTLARADKGLSGRLIVGYQGWFECPADGGWRHWFDQTADLQHLTVDMLPDVTGIPKEQLCDTGLKHADGSPVYVYSALNAAVVARHFAWMRQYGIDGAAAQRFLVDVRNPADRDRADRVLRNIRDAAEASGRVFYVTYDVSGDDPKTVVGDIRRDWTHLAHEVGITHSRAYLTDHGKPVLELWGFGFSDRPGEPAEVATLIGDLKTGLTVIGGVPTQWRELGGDSKSDPAWAAVYRSYDVISPWMVGRFVSEDGADDMLASVVTPDLAETHKLGLRYMPVIFPGFSWANLARNRGAPDDPNRIPRQCGRFLWRQVFDLEGAHVDALYGAMFDEVDEGTALYRTVPTKDGLPAGATMIALDQDGCQLPADWYLRVTGKAADYLHKGAAPPKSLDDVIKP